MSKEYCSMTKSVENEQFKKQSAQLSTLIFHKIDGNLFVKTDIYKW